MHRASTGSTGHKHSFSLALNLTEGDLFLQVLLNLEGGTLQCGILVARTLLLGGGHRY